MCFEPLTKNRSGCIAVRFFLVQFRFFISSIHEKLGNEAHILRQICSVVVKLAAGHIHDSFLAVLQGRNVLTAAVLLCSRSRAFCMF